MISESIEVFMFPYLYHMRQYTDHKKTVLWCVLRSASKMMVKQFMKFYR